MNMKDATLALFYSFSAFFHGDYVRMLNLKFREEAPYFDINIFYLDEMLRDVWIQYQLFISTLENSNNFTNALLKKYKEYYEDYFVRYEEYLEEVSTREQYYEVSKLRENFDKLLKVGENLGHLACMLDDRYELIKKAVERVKEGEEISEASIICKVNKLTYPDECYQKILQMRNVTMTPRIRDADYKSLKSKNYERQVYKYNNIYPPVDRLDTEEEETMLE